MTIKGKYKCYILLVLTNFYKIEEKKEVKLKSEDNS
jgi:hypothetical protein